MTPLARLPRPPLSVFLRQHAVPGLPVILTGLTDGWAARRWTPEGLAARCPGAEVELAPAGSRYEGVYRATLPEYAAYLRAPDERLLYLTSWCFRRHCPELAGEFEIPEYFREDWLELLPAPLLNDMLWLFMGPAGSGMTLHVDLGHTAAWNCQVTGRKRWALVAPEHEERLYDGEVDAFAPDLDRFPLFAGVEVWQGVVEAGEVLFIPGGWWHQTFNLEAGIGLTANYVDATNVERVLRCLEEYGEEELLEALRQVARERWG